MTVKRLHRYPVIGSGLFLLSSLFLAAQAMQGNQVPAVTTPFAPRLEKGIFLVASRTLNDPNFRQTVVLITEHTESGTAGIVINRPMQLPARDAFPPISKLTQDSGNVQVGGPVALNTMQLLVQVKETVNQEQPVFEDIYVVRDTTIFNDLLQGRIESRAARVYMGHAGWAAGQLKMEIMRGDWHLWHADLTTVFSQSPDTVWHDLIALVGAQWANYNQHRIRFPILPGLDV